MPAHHKLGTVFEIRATLPYIHNITLSVFSYFRRSHQPIGELSFFIWITYNSAYLRLCFVVSLKFQPQWTQQMRIAIRIVSWFRSHARTHAFPRLSMLFDSEGLDNSASMPKHIYFLVWFQQRLAQHFNSARGHMCCCKFPHTTPNHSIFASRNQHP